MNIFFFHVAIDWIKYGLKEGPSMSQNCSAVIVAAGNSTRMGIPKQLVAFYGEPALSYTLKAFDQAESV